MTPRACRCPRRVDCTPPGRSACRWQATRVAAVALRGGIAEIEQRQEAQTGAVRLHGERIFACVPRERRPVQLACLLVEHAQLCEAGARQHRSFACGHRTAAHEHQHLSLPCHQHTLVHTAAAGGRFEGRAPHAPIGCIVQLQAQQRAACELWRQKECAAERKLKTVLSIHWRIIQLAPGATQIGRHPHVLQRSAAGVCQPAQQQRLVRLHAGVHASGHKRERHLKACRPGRGCAANSPHFRAVLVSLPQVCHCHTSRIKKNQRCMHIRNRLQSNSAVVCSLATAEVTLSTHTHTRHSVAVSSSRSTALSARHAPSSALTRASCHIARARSLD